MKTTLKLFGAVILTLLQSCTLVDHAPKPTGSALFYSIGVRGLPIDIFVDGAKIGTLALWSRIFVPNCGDEYAVTVNNLTEGTHKYEAREVGVPNPVTFKGSITVVAGQCTKENLVYVWPEDG